MPYNLFDYNIKVSFDKEDQDYIAFIEEIPECSAFGNSPDEAIKELGTAYELWKETVEERGYPVPEPFSQKEYSGKFVIRLPKSLHKELVAKSLRENISLNQYTLYCITRGISS